MHVTISPSNYWKLTSTEQSTEHSTEPRLPPSRTRKGNEKPLEITEVQDRSRQILEQHKPRNQGKGVSGRDSRGFEIAWAVR